MGRKELLNVYDGMKPDEEEKREMYRKIMQKTNNTSEDKINDNSREIILVITWYY